VGFEKQFRLSTTVMLRNLNDLSGVLKAIKDEPDSFSDMEPYSEWMG
jgi:hypothetical protein